MDDEQYEQKIPDSAAEPAETDTETPLLAEVSPEVSEEVSAFMEQAAAQNEAAAVGGPAADRHEHQARAVYLV